MTLPLLERAKEQSATFLLTTKRVSDSAGAPHCASTIDIGEPRIPQRTLQAGEQYRFHFDMAKCIGCKYCTWNCSYGVPQYNPERGVVGKCDMCHNRLAEGREPACVGACPEGAIQIEIVNIADWKRGYAASANAPGLPSADDSLSTTRLTLPELLPPNIEK